MQLTLHARKLLLHAGILHLSDGPLQYSLVGRLAGDQIAHERRRDTAQLCVCWLPRHGRTRDSAALSTEGVNVNV